MPQNNGSGRLFSLSWISQMPNNPRIGIVTGDWWYNTISGEPGIFQIYTWHLLTSPPLSSHSFLPFLSFCFLSYNFLRLLQAIHENLLIVKHQHDTDKTNLPFCISCLISTHFLGHNDCDQCHVEPASPSLTYSSVVNVGNSPDVHHQDQG